MKCYYLSTNTSLLPWIVVFEIALNKQMQVVDSVHRDVANALNSVEKSGLMNKSC